MTTAPLAKDQFGDAAFSYSSDYVFKERWKQGLREPKFLSGRRGSLISIGHHIKDMVNMKMPLNSDTEFGINAVPPTDTATGDDAFSGMAGNRLFEWQNREYKEDKTLTHRPNSHHHHWEVVYYCPKGQMVTHLARYKGETRTVAWGEGDLIIVEPNEFHQHYGANKGTRFLQFKPSGQFRNKGLAEDGEWF
jgi:hypothetical protein